MMRRRALTSSCLSKAFAETEQMWHNILWTCMGWQVLHYLLAASVSLCVAYAQQLQADSAASASS